MHLSRTAIFVLALAGVALLPGCGANDSAQQSANEAANSAENAAAAGNAASVNGAAPASSAAVTDSDGGSAILVNLERVSEIPATPNDHVTVSDVKFVTGIGGHFITAKVRYGGGCRPHVFKAYWNGSWARSNPPGIAITLRHNANGDTCEALFNQMVQINIAEPAAANKRFWVELTNVSGPEGRVDVVID